MNTITTSYETANQLGIEGFDGIGAAVASGPAGVSWDALETAAFNAIPKDLLPTTTAEFDSFERDVRWWVIAELHAMGGVLGGD